MAITAAMVTFFVVAILVLTGIHTLFWARLIRDTEIPAPWKAPATIMLVVLGVSIPLSLFLNRMISFDTARLLLFAPFIWIGAMLLIFTLLASTDILRLLVALGGRLSGHGAVLEQPERRKMVARIIAGGTLLTVGGLGVLGSLRALGPITVRTLEVTLARLPRELTGFTIVQITDLHVGLVRGNGWVRYVVDLVNSLHPDPVLTHD